MKSFYEMLELLNKIQSNQYIESREDDYEDGDDDDDGDRDRDRYDDGPEPPSEKELEKIRYQREIEAERKRLFPHEGKFEEKWVREVGKTPNGKKYNLVVHIWATTEDVAKSRVWSFEDFHHGAKYILDIRRSKSENQKFPILYKMYVMDNHGAGFKTPFKDEPHPGDERDRTPPTPLEPRGMSISIPPVMDEATLNEMEVTDPELQQKIKEFGFLSDQIDRIRGELKALEGRYDEIEDVLRPILDEMKETGDKTLQVEDIIVTVKKYGHPRQSVGYKEACMYLLDRVNASMKKIAQEALDANTKMVQIATSIGVQKSEDFFGNVLSLLKNFLIRVWKTISFQNKEIDDALADFKNVSRMEGTRYSFSRWVENKRADDPTDGSWWAHGKVGSSKVKVGPYRSRKEAVEEMFKQHPKAYGVTTGHGYEQAAGHIYFHKNPSTGRS